MTIDSNGQMAKQKRQQYDRNDDDADDDYGEEDKTSEKTVNSLKQKWN